MVFQNGQARCVKCIDLREVCESSPVRWLYAQLGLADRVEIEFFQGGHSIKGEGTFAFLQKHPDWPEPSVGHEPP